MWLKPNVSQTITWSQNNNVIGRISYVLSRDSITLLYNHGTSSNEPESINDEITLVKTPCNFCRYFRCHKCREIDYASTKESKLDRSRRALAKYQSILAPDLELCPADTNRGLHKFKGMRYKTCFDIKKRAFEKEDEMNKHFLAAMKMLR